jgi:hypothetical protein
MRFGLFQREFFPYQISKGGPDDRNHIKDVSNFSPAHVLSSEIGNKIMKIHMSIPPKSKQMSNEVQMTECQNIFSFDRKIKYHVFFTMGLRFHLIPP